MECRISFLLLGPAGFQKSSDSVVSEEFLQGFFNFSLFILWYCAMLVMAKAPHGGTYINPCLSGSSFLFNVLTAFLVSMKNSPWVQTVGVFDGPPLFGSHGFPNRLSSDIWFYENPAFRTPSFQGMIHMIYLGILRQIPEFLKIRFWDRFNSAYQSDVCWQANLFLLSRVAFLKYVSPKSVAANFLVLHQCLSCRLSVSKVASTREESDCSFLVSIKNIKTIKYNYNIYKKLQ